MPFKLRLRKSRQYNVVSKSLFVIGIELLDSTSVECTLATESLGRECLDNICQKLSFQQPEFFGLRYLSNNGAPRWIELDRPLKRQLDKHAMKYLLYLRIMYYVSGISLLTDEMTRYHYFLQLKSDVIEGRIKCNVEQAILLASYSMQAEFGNHDTEKHTPEYLKEFVLFPKHVSGHQVEITEAVICQHAALAGLPQGTAEEYYILAAQHLEGYGQEVFMAKDGSANEVIIGISLIGINVKIEVLHFTKFYKWKDITNVVNHKRYFGIECQIPEETVHYQFSDVESAKYVWRMCVHQHTFFIQYGQSSEQGNTAEIVKALFTSHQNEDSHLSSSHEEFDSEFKNDEVVLDQDLRLSGEGSYIRWNRQKAQSTSCLNLSSGHPEVDHLRTLLPGYRPAPDYETAIQQKYHNQSSNTVRNMLANSVLYSSHPDIHSAVQSYQRNNLNPSIYKHPEVTHTDQFYNSGSVTIPHSNVIHTYSTPELDTVTTQLVPGMQMIHVYKSPPSYPINRPSSNSTPDLATQTFAQHSHCFISPQVSGSSPDLVSSRSSYNVPYTECHTSQNLGGVLPNVEAHRTYPNLTAAVDPQQKINNMKAKLDPLGMYLKRQNGAVLGQSANYLFPSNQYSGVDISEPIYENVPLPWPTPVDNNVSGGRSRASSIQSAPEINNTTAIKDKAPLANIINEYRRTSLTNARISNTKCITVSSTSANVSSSNKMNLGNHSVTTSIDSSNLDSNHSGTLGKDRHRGRKKWGGILSGKHKHSNRHDVDSMDGQRAFYDLLPKHPLPTTIPKEQMCQLLERKLEDSQLVFEFEKIPRIKTNADFTTALLPENINRNWNKDILPYEENRVRLSPTKGNKHGFINASNITASVGHQQKFYIAAQSPMPSTVGHFWQMIWETDVYLVVSLADMSDSSTIPYFHNGVSDKPCENGEFHIWSQFSQETGHCVTTKLRVLQSSSRRVRAVWHLQYNEWINDGCPKDVAHFLGFIEEMSSVRQHTITEIPVGHNRNPPILVHCCTGIGRTAVTILSDLLLYTLDHNQALDIARTVLLMRHQRMFMIETVAQYRFVYSLLAYYLKNSRLI